MIIMPGNTVFGPDDVKYEVLDLIGNGNFGIVHKVRKTGSDQIFAIKTIPGSFPDDIALKAFVNEGNLALGIRHTNVIEYYFFHDGSKYENLPPYILMEYADGGTLDHQIAKASRDQKVFSNSDLFATFKQLIAGMKAINEKLVHRDVKPDNILVSKNTLKISDFGLSKVVTEGTRTSSFKGFGCMPYMAPEVWRSQKNTPQLDIYSMGIVFYQLATLRHPFDVPIPDQQKWMEAHLYQAIPNPNTHNSALSVKLSQIIIKMVEKDPVKRFKNWSEIESFLDGAEEKTNNPANVLVEKMLKRRLSQDSADQAAEAEGRRKQDEITQFCRLVLSQAEQSVISPVKEIISKFNREYTGGKIVEDFYKQDAQYTYRIGFLGQKQVNIIFQVLLEKDFIREVDGWITGRRLKVVRIPTFKGRRVQGWGFVQGSDKRGFNILLVERQDELYGEFVIMEKRLGVTLNPGQLPDPQLFLYNELEEKLRMNQEFNLNSSDTRSFDIDYVCQFVTEYV